MALKAKTDQSVIKTTNIDLVTKYFRCQSYVNDWEISLHRLIRHSKDWLNINVNTASG